MNRALDINYLSPGFDDPELANQQTFRAMVKALDHPGHPVQIKNKPSIPGCFNPAFAALFLMLCHEETTVWADLNWDFPLIEWFQYQCGCTLVTEPCMASLALITKPATMPPLDHFRISDHEQPETVPTLIVEVDGLSAGTSMGPMPTVISQMTIRKLMEVPVNFWNNWHTLPDRRPPSLDVFLTCDNILTALPH